MTFTIDTNILVFAADSSSRRQRHARQPLDWAAAGPQAQVVTHPSIFAEPLHPEAAAAAVERLIALPHVRIGGELEDFWSDYRRVADDVKPRGNLVPDTHLVALMRQHGVPTIWSHDRDFRKFPGITVKDPFDQRYATGFE